MSIKMFAIILKKKRIYNINCRTNDSLYTLYFIFIYACMPKYVRLISLIKFNNKTF